MKVKLLSIGQKESLVGIQIADSHFYNPIEDANGNWFISLEECEQTTNPDYLWIKDLYEIDYNPTPFGVSQFNLVNNQ
jgi:hypothetical protein